MIDTRAFLLETLGLHTRPTEARGRIIVAEAETETTEENEWAEGEALEQEKGLQGNQAKT